LIVERDSLPASENPSSENKTATYVADTFGFRNWCSAGLLIAHSWLLDTGKYASGWTALD